MDGPVLTSMGVKGRGTPADTRGFRVSDSGHADARQTLTISLSPLTESAPARSAADPAGTLPSAPPRGSLGRRC